MDGYLALKRVAMPAALLVALSLMLGACGLGRDNVPAASGQSGTEGGTPGDGGAPDTPGTGGTPGAGGGPTIEWGPRLSGSGLSEVSGATDAFGAVSVDVLARAARAAPNGASQSSAADGDGRTVDEVSVAVVRDDDGNLVYEVTDKGQYVARAPLPIPRQDGSLALFTDLIPGIEPDLSSFPHEVLGIWAWNGSVTAFWASTQPLPAVEFGPASPTGTATYEGDAVGLHAADGAVTKFLADVTMTADFGGRTIGGEVAGFRSLAGKAFGGLSVTLEETDFAADGAPFAGDTASGDAAGGGKWGARWSDRLGETMGGTFGFAADDRSVTLLGAFSACHCASAAPGNPDDPVASNPR